MKRILILLLLSMGMRHNAMAQQTEIYNSEKAHLSLTYPSTFHTVPIDNAPHMLIHLQNNKNEEYAISYWDYGIDKSIDIWNPVFYQKVEQNAKKIPDLQLISCSKTIINLKSRKVKAAEMIHTKNLGQKKKYFITYQTLWRGNLIQILYISEDSFVLESTKGRALLKNIQLQ